MESKATQSFWAAYQALPAEIRKTADKQFHTWLDNPAHPSIQFKKVSRYWSARVTNDYRAVGVRDENTIIWFWIGSHGEYDQLLKRK